MSTQSPPPPPSQGYGPQYGMGMPSVPAPTSELVLYVLALVIIALIVAIDDTVGAGSLVTALIALTVGYLLSRGLAKLGKVIENR